MKSDGLGIVYVFFSCLREHRTELQFDRDGPKFFGNVLCSLVTRVKKKLNTSKSSEHLPSNVVASFLPKGVIMQTKIL